MKHPLLPLLLILALAACLLAGSPLRAQGRQKNVVLIVADDQGRELGCYGDRVIRTPHLDRLAAEGTRFEYAFTAVSSCSPSRAALLSGLHTHSNGMYGLQHATHKQTSQAWVRGLPNLLVAAGYRTCSIGKYHVAPEESYHFDTYANEGIMGSRSTVRMAENAEKWIRSESGKPFFLYFCFTDPHRAAKGFANDRPYPGIEEVKYDPARIPVPEFLPDRPEVRQDLAEYYQSVSRLDQGVGRLMQALKDTGHLDDTLVVYLSDNGIPFPGAKTNLYDPGIRLPLIVRAPDQKTRGVVSQAMVSWVDIAPTLLEYTGAKGPEYPLQGRSFLSVLSQTDPPGWDEVYGSHQFHEITMYYPMRMVRTRRYKYLLNLAHPLPFPAAEDLYNSPTWQGILQRGDARIGKRATEAFLHRPRHELYDLQADPQELVNLAEKKEYAEVLAGLQAKLKTWQQTTKDPWLLKYTHE